MQVPADTAIDDLQLFDKEAVRERSLRSVRSIEDDEADPACPLKWTHKSGKKKCCDAATLRAYLAWLRNPVTAGASRRRPSKGE